MPTESTIVERMDAVIQYLISIDMIDGKNPKSAIANRTGYNSGNVSSALNGNPKYLTERFIKTFCAKYNNIISFVWIITGEGEMIANEPKISQDDGLPISEENLNKLTKENLVSLVKRLMDIHKEQTDMYKSIIRQSEEIIRNGQEQFNSITNLINKSA